MRRPSAKKETGEILSLAEREKAAREQAEEQKVKIQDDGFLFKLNIVQFIIFPFRVFNNENEIRFLKSILNRKGYVR